MDMLENTMRLVSICVGRWVTGAVCCMTYMDATTSFPYRIFEYREDPLSTLAQNHKIVEKSSFFDHKS